MYLQQTLTIAFNKDIKHKTLKHARRYKYATNLHSTILQKEHYVVFAHKRKNKTKTFCRGFVSYKAFANTPIVLFIYVVLSSKMTGLWRNALASVLNRSRRDTFAVL